MDDKTVRELCMKYHQMAGRDQSGEDGQFISVGALGYKLSKQLALEAYEMGRLAERKATESEGV